MQVYDPTASGPQRVLSRAPAIARLECGTIGVLEDGRLNAVEMLRELAALFEARTGASSAGFIPNRTPAPLPPPASSPRRRRRWIF